MMIFYKMMFIFLKLCLKPDITAPGVNILAAYPPFFMSHDLHIKSYTLEYSTYALYSFVVVMLLSSFSFYNVGYTYELFF